MVFGNCGVLQEMTSEKGFVEMTGIDAETSQDIAEVIMILVRNLSRLVFPFYNVVMVTVQQLIC